MTLIRRLQDWCLFLMLVSSGTLGGAMGLIWLSARLGPLAPDPDATHPMEPVVIGLVMAIAATGISYVLALLVLLFRPQGLFGEKIIARV